jgi:signal peptidase I
MPSASMWPTISAGTTFAADPSIKVPARGDAFVFKDPEHPEQSRVQRIVGLPGDIVETSGHSLSINGKLVPSCWIGPFSFMSEGQTHEGDLVLEGAGYIVFYERIPFVSDGAWTVAPGEFWAMGDNRRNSYDSRLWFDGKGGGVPQAFIEGKVETAPSVLPPGASALSPNLEECKKQLGISS